MLIIRNWKHNNNTFLKINFQINYYENMLCIIPFPFV